MKTINDGLSFNDLTLQTVVEATELEGSNDLRKMSERWIHTFLEWDLYNKFIYCDGWSLEYVSASQGDPDPVIATAKVDTLQEAKIMAAEKFSRYLGTPIHLEQDEMVEGDLYKVMDNSGAYHGLIEIKATS